MQVVRNHPHRITATKASLLMNRILNSRYTRVVLVALMALAAAAVVTGCNKNTAETPSGGTTAKGNVEVAKSSLSTTAPDAKLLLVQTANVVTETSTPVWQYLFGSPKDGSIYAVTVKDGKVVATEPYGTAGMEDAEWAQVPGADEWKIDSDAAYDAALKANSKNTKATPWAMGFVTYVPKSAESSTTIDAFKWSVAFDPQSQTGSANSVDVDAKTGEATVAK